MYYGDEFELSEVPEWTFLGLQIFTTIKNDFWCVVIGNVLILSTPLSRSFWGTLYKLIKSFKAIMNKHGIFSQLSKWQLFQKLLKDKTCKIDSCELYCTALAGLYFKNWPETVMKITNLVRLRNYGYVLDLVFFEQTKVFFWGGFWVFYLYTMNKASQF